MGYTLLSSPDPQVGRPFKLTLEIKGTDSAGKPLAIVDDSYEVFSKNSLNFVRNEKKITYVETANDHLATIEFGSRDGFMFDGDQELWVEKTLDPTVRAEITVKVAPVAKVAATPPRESNPSRSTEPTETQAPRPSIIVNPAVLAPAAKTTVAKKILAIFKNQDVAEWIIAGIAIIAMSVCFFFHGYESRLGWGISIIFILSALITKGGRNKLGWAIAAAVVVSVILLVRMIIGIIPFAVNQIADNGATAGVPEAPQIPAPPTPLERKMEKILDNVVNTPTPVTPSVTATVTTAEPKIVEPSAKPVEARKKKTGSLYKIPTL